MTATQYMRKMRKKWQQTTNQNICSTLFDLRQVLGIFGHKYLWGGQLKIEMRWAMGHFGWKFLVQCMRYTSLDPISILELGLHVSSFAVRDMTGIDKLSNVK